MEETMRKNSVKNTRINGEVQRALAEIIRGEIKDPRIAPMTSVVAVEVAPDLKTCKAWISVLGDEKAQEDTLAGLESAEGYIRGQLARIINLRNTPQLQFIMDQSIAYGVNMSKRIEEVVASDRAAVKTSKGKENEEDQQGIKRGKDNSDRRSCEAGRGLCLLGYGAVSLSEKGAAGGRGRRLSGRTACTVPYSGRNRRY